MPACLPRRSDLRVLLRVSVGSRRRSSPSSSIRSKAQRDRGRAGPRPADEVENSKPFLVGDDRLAIDEAGPCRQRRDSRGGQREAPCEIVAVTREEPHPIAVAPRHDAEAVVLDFVNPARPRRLIRKTWQAPAQWSRLRDVNANATACALHSATGARIRVDNQEVLSGLVTGSIASDGLLGG